MPAASCARAVVAPEDAGRVSGNMRLRVFSERAVRAVMDPNCANLPLPQTMLGQISDVHLPVPTVRGSHLREGSDMTGLPNVAAQPPLAARRRRRFRCIARGSGRGSRAGTCAPPQGRLRRRRPERGHRREPRAHRSDPDRDPDARRRRRQLRPARPGHRDRRDQRPGAIRPVPADRAAGVHPGRRPARATCRTSRTGRRSARRRWSPDAPRRRAADRSGSNSACGTCCRRPRSRAPPTPPAKPTGAASPTSSPT